MSEGAVYKLMKERGMDFKPSGQDFVIKCLSPDHIETNPSLRIDKTTGVGHCFSCGHNVNIFKYFGLLSNPISVRIAGLKNKLEELVASTTGLEMMRGATPVTAPFRGISLKTLRKFEAFSTNLVPNMEDRIIFPIRDITGKIRSFIGRHTHTSTGTKYLISPSGVSLPIFPARLESVTNYIVLVEGTFDFLNMYDKGLTSTVCVYGTQTLLGKDSLNNTRLKLLPFKTQGVTHIFIMFDGDNAGQSAAKALQPILEQLDFVVTNVELTEGDDPGVLSVETVQQYKEYFNATSNTPTNSGVPAE